jgi:hypothetical protein
LLKEACEYKVRNFEDGDEIEIIRLFNRTYANYGGFVPRTPEYWLWCCLKRPDVEREGLFVVTDENENIVGYAVVGRSGNVWELCYDPMREGEKILSLLLNESVCYVEKVGATSITFNAVTEDNATRQVCRNLGFATLPSPEMFLSILNFRELISLLVNSKKEGLMKKFDEVVLLKLNDAPFWVDSTIFIRIGQDGVHVGNETQSHTIYMETDITTFSSLLLGILGPFKSLISLRLKVRPFWKIPNLLKLLSAIQIKGKWFFPLSDHG